MKNIEVKVLNPSAIADAEKMMVAMARMTQRAHKITNMADLMELINKPYTEETVRAMAKLPHPTIQKFAAVNIAVVGASRRFLAQITRHQNEVKFMSGSLQYSDYSGAAQFVVPYAVTAKDKEEPYSVPNIGTYDDYWTTEYLRTCKVSASEYDAAVKAGIDNDAAGYLMPQGLRNVLVVSVLPFELKHIISQRICNRNTLETQFVSLLIWEELVKHSAMFDDCGPSCIKHSACDEGKMSCRHFLYDVAVNDFMQVNRCSLPTAILHTKFKYLYEGEEYETL